MTNDQRLDRLERILTLIVRSGRRGRTRVRQSILEIDEKITMLINAQIRNEDELQTMNERAESMRDELDRRSREVFDLFQLTDHKIAQLADAQLKSQLQIQGLEERSGRPQN